MACHKILILALAAGLVGAVSRGVAEPDSEEVSESCPQGRLPVSVMNLNSRYDRWERTSVRMTGLSLLDPSTCLEVERFVATDGAKDPIPASMVAKTWDTSRNRKFVGNGTWYDKVDKKLKLTAGERGCAASHIRLWKKVAKGSKPMAIIEDDAVPVPNLGKMLQTAFTELPADADILYLGYSRPDAAPFRADVGESLHEVDYVWTTIGYIVYPKGARKLLSRLPIDSPVDNFMSWASHTNHTKAYAMREAVLKPEAPWNFASDVKHSDEKNQHKHEDKEFREKLDLATRPFIERFRQIVGNPGTAHGEEENAITTASGTSDVFSKVMETSPSSSKDKPKPLSKLVENVGNALWGDGRGAAQSSFKKSA